MVPASAVTLHGNPVLEFTLLEYLLRVVLSLFTFGGIAVVVFWGLGVVSAVRSRVAEKRGAGESNR